MKLLVVHLLFLEAPSPRCVIKSFCVAKNGIDILDETYERKFHVNVCAYNVLESNFKDQEHEWFMRY